MVSNYPNILRGDYDINGRVMYFRSKWEADYALYLDFLKKHKKIKGWRYEPRFFDFPVKHGTTRYLPDFEVEENNGELVYHEVKGYMDSKSKTKLKRMAKYYPKVKIILIGKAEMKAIAKYDKLIKVKKV